MKDYTAFGVEDFIEDPAFQDWVYRGINDPEWQQWLFEHPTHQVDVDQARNVLLSIRGELDELPAHEVKASVQRILSSTQAHDQDIAPDWPARRNRPLWRNYFWEAMAACLILAGGLGWLLSGRDLHSPVAATSRQTVQQSSAQFETVVNEGENQKVVNLPDGSSVLLKKGSRLRFPSRFNSQRREVTLSGEAFFEVHKKPDHPFFVYANEMVTKVIGTSFSISAYDSDREVRLRVKTGKVSVFAQKMDPALSEPKGKAEIVLFPNQQAVLLRSDLKIALLRNDRRDTAEIPIETENFEFRRTPVTEVFNLIETTYNISISYDATLLSKCTITAILGDEPLLEKLNIICEVIDATYQVNGDKIEIEAKGCG
jgi:transmembrane sensor